MEQAKAAASRKKDLREIERVKPSKSHVKAGLKELKHVENQLAKAMGKTSVCQQKYLQIQEEFRQARLAEIILFKKLENVRTVMSGAEKSPELDMQHPGFASSSHRHVSFGVANAEESSSGIGVALTGATSTFLGDGISVVDGKTPDNLPGIAMEVNEEAVKSVETPRKEFHRVGSRFWPHHSRVDRNTSKVHAELVKLWNDNCPIVRKVHTVTDILDVIMDAQKLYPGFIDAALFILNAGE